MTSNSKEMTKREYEPVKWKYDAKSCTMWVDTVIISHKDKQYNISKSQNGQSTNCKKKMQPLAMKISKWDFSKVNQDLTEDIVLIFIDNF